MSDKKFERATHQDRMFLGVAGGLANYFDVDPVFVRLFFVLATLAGNGFGVIVYVVLALVMCNGDSNVKASIIEEDEEIVVKGV